MGRAARVAIYAIKSAPQNCSAGERNSAAIRGFCVIQGIDPRSFLNALFRSFFPVPSDLGGGPLKARGNVKETRRLARRVTMSRAFLPARVRVTPSLSCVRDRDFLLPINTISR